MNRSLPCLACVLFSTVGLALAAEPEQPPSKTYAVQTVKPAAITIDGLLGDAEWPADGWERGFKFPWLERQTPRTEMCCVCDGRSLLFAFLCDESDLVLRGAVPEVESTVADGDRVEMFFAKDPALHEYYCFEMSPAATVLDYRASFYRKFDHSWDCPGLLLRAGTRRGGYVVEGSIPLTTLKEMCGADFSQGQPIRVGAFRAEYSHQDPDAPEAAWISWVHPQVEKADFHIPSALGTFRLKN
ncbi:MAG: carbohydrate-binding family 9-like protein [Thermoguttaceae bacterium]